MLDLHFAVLVLVRVRVRFRVRVGNRVGVPVWVDISILYLLTSTRLGGVDYFLTSHSIFYCRFGQIPIFRHCQP